MDTKQDTVDVVLEARQYECVDQVVETVRCDASPDKQQEYVPRCCYFQCCDIGRNVGELVAERNDRD
jgi:hypothetical protein